MKTKTQRGFSLIESVVSIAIGLSVAVVLIAVVVAGLREVRVVSAASDMQTNVIFVGESLARLVQESRIIAVDTGNPERLTITLPDNSVHVVEKVDGQIMLDGTPITSNDVTVTNLVFTLFPTAGPIPIHKHSVVVDVTYQGKNGTSPVSVTTTFMRRNGSVGGV